MTTAIDLLALNLIIVILLVLLVLIEEGLGSVTPVTVRVEREDRSKQ